MISRRHVAQETILTPSRLRRDAPTQTGATVRNPGPFTVPDTVVLTWQDPADRP